MRRFGLLLAWLLVGLPVFPQIYRVGGITLSSLDALSGPSWEVGAGVFASTATLHVEKGEDAFRGEAGFAARGLYALSSWAALGVEGQFSRAKDASVFIDDYRVLRVGGVGKFTITPDTNPRAYLLLGAGVVRREVQSLRFLAGGSTDGYATVGWGLEAHSVGGWFGGVELYGMYDSAPRLNAFLRVPRRWTAGAHLRFGLQF